MPRASLCTISGVHASKHPLQAHSATRLCSGITVGKTQAGMKSRGRPTAEAMPKQLWLAQRSAMVMVMPATCSERCLWCCSRTASIQCCIQPAARHGAAYTAAASSMQPCQRP
jgi:hypothetical protein